MLVKIFEMFVKGKAAPGGSFVACTTKVKTEITPELINKITKHKGKLIDINYLLPEKPRPYIRPSGKFLPGWRKDVARQAKEQYNGEYLTGPLICSYIFRFPFRKGDFGTGANSNKLKASAPKHHTTFPDLTKIIRSTEDALTGIVWEDDKQVIGFKQCKKCYSTEEPGVVIKVYRVKSEETKKCSLF